MQYGFHAMAIVSILLAFYKGNPLGHQWKNPHWTNRMTYSTELEYVSVFLAKQAVDQAVDMPVT